MHKFKPMKIQIHQKDRRDMNQRLSQWTLWFGNEFADLLFPRRCPVCGGIVMPKEEMVCVPCREKLSVVRQPVCKKCGKEVADEKGGYFLDCTRPKRKI